MLRMMGVVVAVAVVLVCGGPARGQEVTDEALRDALDRFWDPDEPLPGSVRFSVPPDSDWGEPIRFAFVRRGEWDMVTVYHGGGWSSGGDDGPPYCLRLDRRTVVTVPGWTSYEADDNGVVWCSGADCPAAVPYRERTPIPPDVAREALATSGACDELCTWTAPMRITGGGWGGDDTPEGRRMERWSWARDAAERGSREDRRLWLLCGGPEPEAYPEPPRPLTGEEILTRQEAALRRLEARLDKAEAAEADDGSDGSLRWGLGER